MTFSVVARCQETGMFGMAVSSSSPAVAARCANARAGVGAVSSQNITDPTLGPKALDLLEKGASAVQARDILRQSNNHMNYRQVLIVDKDGNTAIHSGENSLGIFAEAEDHNIACAGNLLDNDGVPRAMINCFKQTEGKGLYLGDRLIDVMRAALAAGGEAGPIHSIGMRLVDKVSWPVADLRVDWTENCPVEELTKLWNIYKPQLADYVTRGINPSDAPSYGVPGDE
ncbi:DUF1028 domain-containing protein [Curvivirga aplysinae]|uniref:DUF1028 domain-containing protein n=1 Tax=Curvivirga aplysinae TaxID=2529852 RepID=UPI0012BCC1D7|nr:DUF1028 domain-containing protein [Curvivirga aplysinae]MTI10991.1 DUF1028 domain-containing protein [Curvivirga aplysinae]